MCSEVGQWRYILMYAVIRTGGKQYRVQKGDVIRVERIALDNEVQQTYSFPEVLLLADGDKVTVGDPTVKGAKVTAKILGHGRSKKVVVFKFRPKKDYRRKQGHRQPYTELEITDVALEGEEA